VENHSKLELEEVALSTELAGVSFNKEISRGVNDDERVL
jgi:hypothetical protein